MTCIFCDIVSGRSPCHTVWESDQHLAFLSIYPNTSGFTVVIPKNHYSSYAFKQSDQVLTDLVLAAKQVAILLDEKLLVPRTGLVLEGYGVDHLHAKLIPLHGAPHEFQQVRSQVDRFFVTYEGYLSSHDYKRADDFELAQLALKIRA